MGSDALATAALYMGADGPGYIYGVTHFLFPGFIKIGKSVNPEKRLQQYNTGCPFKGYRLEFNIWVSRYGAAEWKAHELLKDRRVWATEWFHIDPYDALRQLIDLGEVDNDNTGGSHLRSLLDLGSAP